MKNLLKLASICFILLSTFTINTASAQYYSGGYRPYSSWTTPLWTGYSLYGCLKGSYCSNAEKAVTITGLGISAIEEGVYQYQDHKANQQYIQELQYKADQAKAANNPQRVQDFQNIQSLNSFFLDSSMPVDKPTSPSIVPSEKKSSPQITPAPAVKDLRP